MSKELLFLAVIPAGWLVRVWVLKMKTLLAEMHEVAQSPHLYEFDLPPAVSTADPKASPESAVSIAPATIRFEHSGTVG